MRGPSDAWSKKCAHAPLSCGVRMRRHKESTAAFQPQVATGRSSYATGMYVIFFHCTLVVMEIAVVHNSGENGLQVKGSLSGMR